MTNLLKKIAIIAAALLLSTNVAFAADPDDENVPVDVPVQGPGMF